MRTVWLVLAVLGTVLPYAAFVPWVVEHGLDPVLLVTQMFETRIAAFFSLDVVVSAVVVIAVAVRGQLRGVRFAWLAIVGTLTVGVSCGLPLYLFLAERDTTEGATAPAA